MKWFIITLKALAAGIVAAIRSMTARREIRNE
jgi:hypothetical protein